MGSSMGLQGHDLPPLPPQDVGSSLIYINEGVGVTHLSVDLLIFSHPGSGVYEELIFASRPLIRAGKMGVAEDDDVCGYGVFLLLVKFSSRIWRAVLSFGFLIS